MQLRACGSTNGRSIAAYLTKKGRTPYLAMLVCANLALRDKVFCFATAGPESGNEEDAGGSPLGQHRVGGTGFRCSLRCPSAHLTLHPAVQRLAWRATMRTTWAAVHPVSPGRVRTLCRARRAAARAA